MSDVTSVGYKPNLKELMQEADAYLLDAEDLASVLRIYLNSDDENEFSRSAIIVCEIERLIEKARVIVVDA